MSNDAAPTTTDPRNSAESDSPTMPGRFIDSAPKMPGGQPEDDTPPSKTLADETASSDDAD